MDQRGTILFNSYQVIVTTLVVSKYRTVSVT